MSKKNTPKWREADYTPFFLIDQPIHTDREVRAEYTRLRDIMMKRANRLEAAGLGVQAEYIRSTMPRQKGMDISEVKERLAQGHALYNERSYQLKGVAELQKYYSDEGADIKLGDVLGFDAFMRSWRMSPFSKVVVTSEDAVNAYQEYSEIGGSFADFYTIYFEKRIQ